MTSGTVSPTVWTSGLHSHPLRKPAQSPRRRTATAGFAISGGDAVTTDTRIDPATTEARCRRLMAERAYLPDAYPHRDKRADLWALIHAELDAWLEAMS